MRLSKLYERTHKGLRDNCKQMRITVFVEWSSADELSCHDNACKGRVSCFRACALVRRHKV